jgi:hypothetical protein
MDLEAEIVTVLLRSAKYVTVVLPQSECCIAPRQSIGARLAVGVTRARSLWGVTEKVQPWPRSTRWK